MHIQTSTGGTGRRPDFKATYHAKKLFEAPLFAVTNKELRKAAHDAAKALDLKPSAFAVLERLAVVYGGQQLAHGLLCWPSNAHISEATRLSERTVRRAISDLRDQGLITMRDSANGKRFPIKNAKGEIVDARGFDLTPLHARAPEFADRVRLIEIDAQVRRQLRDDLTAARNSVYDLCAADPEGAYAAILARAEAVARPDRAAAADELATAIEHYVALADEARAIRYSVANSDETPGYGGQNDRHSEQNSKLPIEDCNQDRSGAQAPQLSQKQRACGARNAAFRGKEGASVRQTEQRNAIAEKAIPKDLALWREACPELSDYGPVTSIEQAAVLGAQIIRRCGLAPHAFMRAADTLGAVNAGLLAVFVWQRHSDGERSGGTPVRSPGGLFVTLAREIANGHYDLTKHLSSMQRRRRMKLFH